jgi:glycosyltransferase involved in cell wall biosynthesis
LKILLINDYGTSTGGAEVITISLRDELRRRGHDARLLTSSAGTASYPSKTDYECFGTTGRWRTLLQCVNISAILSVRHLLREFKPDVVHVNLYLTQLSPFIIRELKGLPIVYYAQWYRTICPKGTKLLRDGSICAFPVGAACLREGCLSITDWYMLMFQTKINNNFGQNFSRVIAISKLVADKLDTFGAPYLRNAAVIHPGTEAKPIRQRISKEPTLVIASRLVTEKGVDVIIRAVAIIVRSFPNCRLMIAGDGPERSSLEGLAQDLGIMSHVAFLGQLSHDETLALIRKAWAVCIPSLWDEHFGLIVVEALMHGVAVIASNSGGIREIICHGETGVLVTPGDVQQFAACILHMLGNKEHAVALGLAGRRHAESCFSIESFATRFEEVYTSLVNPVVITAHSSDA